MHRSHEHLAKIAIEICDGVMVHSLLGNLKPGDIPAEVRQEAISTLVEHYFVENTVVQSGYPLDMRYAGPREALLHALFRQNYGCSHLIVGRDHAGVGDYYGPFDAHHIFDRDPQRRADHPAAEDRPGPSGATSAAPWPACAPARTPPTTAYWSAATKLRKLLSEGGDVPDNFSRPEVLEVLRNYYQGLQEHEKVKVELKGHSAR